MKKLHTGKFQTCPPHLQTVSLPWEVQKVIFQQDSTLFSIKQLILNVFPNFVTRVTKNSTIKNVRDAFIGQSRSSNIVPFHMLDIVSYCAIVTLSL